MIVAERPSFDGRSAFSFFWAKVGIFGILGFKTSIFDSRTWMYIVAMSIYSILL